MQRVHAREGGLVAPPYNVRVCTVVGAKLFANLMYFLKKGIVLLVCAPPAPPGSPNSTPSSAVSTGAEERRSSPPS